MSIVDRIEWLEEQFDHIKGEVVALKKEAMPMGGSEPKIDWSKLPKDTLVAVRESSAGSGVIRYFSNVSDNMFCTYNNGGTSRTGAEFTRAWPQMRILENKPQAWLGGECPIPDGVRYKLWWRDRGAEPREATTAPSELRWSHIGSTEDIIALQILGDDKWHTVGDDNE